MALGRKKEDHGHADLEAEVAALKKELAALKRTLAALKKGGGSGSDPRVDKLIEAMKTQHPRWEKSLDKAGL